MPEIRFDHFVILADMRTGSNFLEASLAEYRGIHVHGELFNPHFIGAPGRERALGVTLQERESDPLALLGRVRTGAGGIHGFRFFPDHDPRVLRACLDERRCAKIILSRNPLDSYVSREIARKTDQWRLGDMQHARTAKIVFDPQGFAQHLERLRDFRARVKRALQLSGQTAFHLSYEELSDIEVINGLARFLGVSETRRSTSTKTKRQNPQPLREKVVNHDEMRRALADLDRFGLETEPDFEPPRGPMIRRYMAAPESPLLFMPMRSGPIGRIRQWLADLDRRPPEDIREGFTQKALRQWKRKAAGHVTFTVLCHPAERLHRAFLRRILLPGPAQYAEIRRILCTRYGLELPEDPADPGYDASAHRRAFIGFANFVRGNLNGQTGIRVDGAWATQTALLRGMGEFVLPTRIFRESELGRELAHLARSLGREPPALSPPRSCGPFSLRDIHDDEVEEAVRVAHQRDYMMFGFGRWQGG